MLTRWRRLHLDVGGLRVAIRRTRHGVAEIAGTGDLELAAGLGFVHAHDRMVQMELTRLAGRGRLSQFLAPDDDTEAIDVFMRELALARGAASELAALGGQARDFAEAYAAGVNHWLGRQRPPLELLLVGHRPAPWTPEDTLLVIKLMSYVGLAQSQEDLERCLVQLLAEGVPAGPLRRLCAPHLDGLSDELVRLLRTTRLHRPLLGECSRRQSGLPAVAGSNAWAVAASHSASGTPLLCCDPHLEVNRLPAIWCEAVMRTDTDFRIGVTMPGVPGLVMGRTSRLAFGFTYGFMDQVDFFLEEVREGKVRRGSSWFEPQEVVEEVRRKGRAPLSLKLRTTDRGQLEADPQAELADGLYLARAWTGTAAGGVQSLEALLELPRCRTVAEGRLHVRKVAISCNWILADRDGHIGYQQSGLAPLRSHSGLHPVPAWDPASAWTGTVAADRLLAIEDPPGGILVSANELRNAEAGPTVVTMSMGPDRAERIEELLGRHDSLSLDDVRRIQLDLRSEQTRRIMALVAPHLPGSPAGRLLAGWDHRYEVGSRAATLFEKMYLSLLERVFGDGLLGRERWRALVGHTGLLGFFFHLFDAALLAPDPWAWGDEGREAVLRQVVGEALADVDVDRIQPWGRERPMVMRNLFFGGRLPAWLGFDHGPVPLPGGRATVVQGQVLRVHGRLTCSAPSWRFVTDLGEDRAGTVLAGGPSGRRLSPWYRSEVAAWLEGRLKWLRPPPPPGGGPEDRRHGGA